MFRMRKAPRRGERVPPYAVAGTASGILLPCIVLTASVPSFVDSLPADTFCSALQPLPRGTREADAARVLALCVQHGVQGGPGAAPGALPEARSTHSAWYLIMNGR